MEDAALRCEGHLQAYDHGSVSQLLNWRPRRLCSVLFVESSQWLRKHYLVRLNGKVLNNSSTAVEIGAINATMAFQMNAKELGFNLSNAVAKFEIKVSEHTSTFDRVGNIHSRDLVPYRSTEGLSYGGPKSENDL